MAAGMRGPASRALLKSQNAIVPQAMMWRFPMGVRGNMLEKYCARGADLAEEKERKVMEALTTPLRDPPRLRPGVIFECIRNIGIEEQRIAPGLYVASYLSRAPPIHEAPTLGGRLSREASGLGLPRVRLASLRTPLPRPFLSPPSPLADNQQAPVQRRRRKEAEGLAEVTHDHQQYQGNRLPKALRRIAGKCVAHRVGRGEHLVDGRLQRERHRRNLLAGEGAREGRGGRVEGKRMEEMRM